MISFLSRIASYWSRRWGMRSRKAWTLASKPAGMSSMTPPTWM